MSARWPWTQRKFHFEFPVGKFPDILSRYRGLPARAEDLVVGLAPAQLTWRETPGSWSLQENLGHLLDLEPLWERRLDEFLQGEDRLSAADMRNAATHAAGHNERAIFGLLAALREARGRLVSRLDELADSEWSREAVHPRLNQRMRLVDAIAFTCDHDDYHLARVAELGRRAPRGG